MKSLIRFIYSFLFIYILYFVLYIFSFFNKKIKESIKERRGWEKRYKKLSNKKKIKKRIWFHVSSYGELEQAKPLINKIKKENKDVDIILTIFSSSGFNNIKDLSDLFFIDYIPLDTVSNIKTVFKYLNPDLVVFIRYDIWPNIVWEAKHNKIPSILINATLSKSSARYSSFLSKLFYRYIYKDISYIACVSQNDYKRFQLNCPDNKNLFLVGDTRFDQVLYRYENSSSVLPVWIKKYLDYKTLVLGSTWESDDEIILKPIYELLNKKKNFNIIIAPHEPRKYRTNFYLNYFKKFKPKLYSEHKYSKVLIVDCLGVLAELYKVSSFCYIGGGFGDGVHSVLEPAVSKVPVCFGPNFNKSNEATSLLKEGCGFTGSSEEEFKIIFKRILSKSFDEKKILDVCKKYINNNIGATNKYYDLIFKNVLRRKI
jgi:3-deoxy-D-manno-octulosonic-acid transferase